MGLATAAAIVFGVVIAVAIIVLVIIVCILVVEIRDLKARVNELEAAPEPTSKQEIDPRFRTLDDPA